ncbi:hypothetical protein BDV27DRAFT_121029 [Aspergillus caelatus]|uniref:Uncharacterized protein n=1 Tax=Aspergillus caelatus TaxID=61420 RepID=A0A5N7AJB4_9EURO|nr:uncharacterized protein BDV27DRAFT_121029 [Aspergillus caelatus]KAE8369258.1 hypothetical protein BDV27DRAFT_121029 [Aspergillus caelatus]
MEEETISVSLSFASAVADDRLWAVVQFFLVGTLLFLDAGGIALSLDLGGLLCQVRLCLSRIL